MGSYSWLMLAGNPEGRLVDAAWEQCGPLWFLQVMTGEPVKQSISLYDVLCFLSEEREDELEDETAHSINLC